MAIASEASGTLPELRVSLASAENIRNLAVQGMQAIPRRGLEVGGLLIGIVHPDDGPGIIALHAAPDMEIEHREGPSFLLSETDVAAFRQAIEAFSGSDGEHVLGWWRSHTRSDELQWDDTDEAITREIFGNRPAMVLLVQPRLMQACEAIATFVTPNSTSATLPFLFPPERLVEEGLAAPQFAQPQPWPQATIDAAHRPAAANGTAAHRALPARAAAPAKPKRDWRQWLHSRFPHRALIRSGWAALLAAIAVLGVMLAASWIPRLQPTEPTPPHQQASTTPNPNVAPEPSVPASPIRLELRTELHGDSMRIRWDGNRFKDAASSGVLTIDDGGKQTKLPLDAADLRAGGILYWPQSNSVTLHLEASAGDTQLVARAEWHKPSQEPAAARQRRESAPREVVRATRRSTQPEPGRRSEARESAIPKPPVSSRTEGWAPTPSSTRAGENSDLRELPASTIAGTALPDRPSPMAETKAAPAQSASCSKEFSLVSYYEPRGKLFFLGPLRKIPGLFRDPGDTEPADATVQSPKATVHSCPNVPLASLPRNQSYVDLLLRIDKEGNVEKAEIDGGGAPIVAAQAANRDVLGWKFRPALLGEKPVTSEMRVRIRFPGAGYSGDVNGQ